MERFLGRKHNGWWPNRQAGSTRLQPDEPVFGPWGTGT